MLINTTVKNRAETAMSNPDIFSCKRHLTELDNHTELYKRHVITLLRRGAGELRGNDYLFSLVCICNIDDYVE